MPGVGALIATMLRVTNEGFDPNVNPMQHIIQLQNENASLRMEKERMESEYQKLIKSTMR